MPTLTTWPLDLVYYMTKLSYELHTLPPQLTKKRMSMVQLDRDILTTPGYIILHFIHKLFYESDKSKYYR